MPEQAQSQEPPPINLKDPLWAGLLAWLVPGLGHAYQGRYAKAVLMFVCIMSTFVYGLYLGSNPHIGWGRVVYFSVHDDLRLPYVCQIGVGLPAFPALVQAYRVSKGKTPLFGRSRFMAPPDLKPPKDELLAPERRLPRDEQKGQGTPWELYEYEPRWFELGTVYTMIAGLLNVLAIYDACCGPVTTEPGKKEEDEPDQEDDEADENS